MGSPVARELFSHNAKAGHSQAICLLHAPKSSSGIFFGDDPLDKIFVLFMVQMIVMSLASRLVYLLLRPLKQPKFVCNTLAGILISPYITGRRYILQKHPFPRYEIIVPKVYAYFGMTYFLFLVSVKMDLTVIRKNIKNATIIGFSSILGSFIVVLGSLLALHPEDIPKGFPQCLMAVFLSLTRFPNVAYTFDELNILASDLGQLAMSSSMVSEFFSWLWIVIRIYYRQTLSMHSTGAILSTIFFITFVLFALRPLIQALVKKAPEGKPVQEVFVVMILVGALLGALLSDFIGALQIGVLFMGLVIPSGPPLGSTLIDKAEFIVMEIIFPMFYVVIGAEVDLASVGLEDLEQILPVVFVGLITKFAAGMGAALFCRLKLQHAMLLGLMLNVKGPFDLYTFLKWLRVKEIGGRHFTVLVISQLVITAIVAPLIDIMYGSYVRINAASVDKSNMRGLHVTPRNHELKVLCCIYNEENVPGMVTLLEAMNPTETAPLSVHIVHLRDLIGRATPMLVPYGDQLRRVKSKRSSHIMQAFDNYLNNSNGAIKARAYSVIAPFKNMHEYIYRLAQDELIPLIILPFHQMMTDIDHAEATSLRNFNIKVQEHAPCTVGILVDKAVSDSMSRTTFQYSIGVIFVSGADDREALSLAIRMSGHPMVSITVLRLVIKSQDMDSINVLEKRLDIQLIEEFKLNTVKNERSTYLEIAVQDTEQGFAQIRSLRGKHNLIIVGRKRKGAMSVFDEQMLNWSENPELGVIGDYVSSADFCHGQTSVLVMQHYSDDIKGSGRYICGDYEGEYLLRRSVC
ncbi:cation/H(+) antiporter 15-like [Punica granatum]|uniref:Cation/H(+) antiporter 15-like n=1 Tax=Punica granatum TaxID=22663 RepID=A0A218XY99_PUNGR|nr:cation/H(+) antiporter 15-like [Punica granatum]OWM89559.1 hypothetical protein CDL15_Pgr024307 [Punica granatum]